jgi:hypothetical protein
LCTSQSPPRGITATTRRTALERALRRAHARDDDNSRRFDPTRARAANIGACIVDIMRRAVTSGSGFGVGRIFEATLTRVARAERRAKNARGEGKYQRARARGRGREVDRASP